MIVKPDKWSLGIIKFSKKAYFHPFEIISRLISGLIFISVADSTVYPQFIEAMGYILTLVGCGLILTPPSRHRQFAVWSVIKFQAIFSVSGVISFIFGGFLVYVGLGTLFLK